MSENDDMKGSENYGRAIGDVSNMLKNQFKWASQYDGNVIWMLNSYISRLSRYGVKEVAW